MKLCNDTITVFNRRNNPQTRMEEYVPTVISGVSWYGRFHSSLGDHGLVSGNDFVVRIPVDADFGGKTYVDPVTYRNETIVSGLFTLAEDDYVVKGAIEGGGMTPASLKENYVDCFKVLGVVDNRRALNAKHFRVVGA